MITYAIMGLIVLFLAFEILYKAEYRLDAEHLFDKQNSNAMRGFWCLIVILVHIPAAYQNRIQDMLGSFAYIGVTFFFMTSVYGLRLGIEKDPDSINVFWRRRLPRLLVPMLLVNIVGMLMNGIEGKQVSMRSLVHINTWVLWLLVCYFIYWLVNCLLTNRGGYQDIVICLLVVIVSLHNYFFNDGWPTEMFGFVWGIILADYKEWFVERVKRRWLLTSTILCIIAGIFGVMYLKFKPVPFYGDYLLKITLGVAITVFILAVNVRMAFGNRVSLFLGKISYEVYLLHGITFGLLNAFFPGLNSGVFIVLSMLITVGLSWVVSIISKSIVSRIDKALIGQ